jgi:hypothetical protein
VDDVAVQRARFAEIDRALADLRERHDLAMSVFKFDEANALQRRIGALEGERQALVAALPAEPTVEPSRGVVPKLAQPRLLRRRR